MTVSLIFPIYNEEKNLQKGVLDKILNYSKSQNQISEILLVDDGSTDTSVKIIKKQYLNKYSQLKLVEKKHSGKAYTLIKGIGKAKGQYILFSDIDLATPIEEADKFIPWAGKYKIVIGSRSAHREGAPLIRRIMAYGAIYVRDLLIGLKGVHDTQCGFKMFEKKAALKIINHLQVFKVEKEITDSSVSAGFDIEFLFVAQKLGYQIKEIPVIWRHVETKNVNFLKDSIESLSDILRIRYMDLKGQYTPLR